MIRLVVEKIKMSRIKAKKSLGQNFLQSEKILDLIIEAGRVSSDDTVLEVGPGNGNLTEKLLKKAGKVIAVEKDDRLISVLENKFKAEIDSEKLILINEDILKISDFRFQISDLKEYKIVANIPYYITGKFLRKFLENEDKPSLIVLMLQKEVARRIVSPKESLLSISVKAFGNPKYIKTVKRGSFRPVPKIDSAILLIDEISGGFFKEVSQEKFFEILKKGFSQKRKKLLSNLRDFGPKEKLEETFKICGIATNSRAEELSLNDWRCLNERLYR